MTRRRGLVAFAALLALTLLWPAIASRATTIWGASDARTGSAFFTDATASSGLSTQERSCPHEGQRQYFVTGQAWADADGDGVVDLYVTNQCGPSTLLRGMGDGRFEPSPIAEQVALPDRQSGGASFADLDNDGWPDLLVLTYDGPILFHNEGGRGFLDITAISGLRAIEGASPVSAAFADYDNDGALDLYIANYGCVGCVPGPRDEVRGQLLHNGGDGHFTDVSAVLADEGPMGLSFVAGWADLDNDGDSDLYVTNDVRGGRVLHGNALYRNDGPGCGGWCFTDVSAASGAGVRADSMGLGMADFDGNGTQDLVVTNSGWAYTPLTGPSLLLANQGDGTFRDVAETSGAAVDAMAWGTAPLDVNDDGWPDIYMALGTDPAHVGQWATTNRLLLNAGGGRFEDVTARSGAADIGDSFGVAVADVNGDGQSDVVVGDYLAGHRLFLGTGGDAGGTHRLAVRLTGTGQVNRDAVGTRIEAVLSDGRHLVHEVRLGGTLGGNDDLDLRTGTGAATVLELRVRWPDGRSQVVHDVPPDSDVRWTYGMDPGIRSLPPVTVHADPPGELGTPAPSIPIQVVSAFAAVGLIALLMAWRRPRPASASPASAWATPVLSSTHASGTGTQRSLHVRGRDYPVQLPSLGDPRLHLAAVITSLQILGQVVLGFELSIAQILVSVITCGVIEFAILFRRSRSIVWPASALLTGNGVAFILRVPGTQHGDWWSMEGWYFFATVAAVSVLSKYLIHDKGRHVFNPSNFGLVLAFLLLGSGRVEPLDFWWGPLSPGVIAALCIIIVGALVILSRLRLLGMAIAFWLVFGTGLAVIAAAGHCMSARWSFEPVCGAQFWWLLVSSPEILVFMFFMMTDPKTTPEGRVARLLFGSLVGIVAALFIAPQQTEFATKVAVLASLTVICVGRPLLERLSPTVRSERDVLRAWLAGVTRPRPDGTQSWARAKLGFAPLLVVLWLALLVPLGAAARVPVAGLRAADAVVSRPSIAVDRSLVPDVAIAPEYRRLDAAITDDRASGIGRDVVADLEIEALARRRSDGELVKTAAAGAHLQDVLRDIDSARHVGQLTLPTYRFESMELVPIYDRANAQAGPQVGIEVRGTVHLATYAADHPDQPIAQHDAPYRSTFAMLIRNGTYLIAADNAV